MNLNQKFLIQREVNAYMSYIDEEFYDQRQPVYNNVKAFPSINSTNNGAVNSEENIRWILKRICNKPFVVGFDDETIINSFIGNSGAGFGRYQQDGIANIDGYLVKISGQEHTSYDDDTICDWNGGGTQGIQRLYTKLTTGIKTNINDYVFYVYRYDEENQIVPESWSSLNTLIPNLVGYMGISYDENTWKEFTDSTYSEYDEDLNRKYEEYFHSTILDNNGVKLDYTLTPFPDQTEEALSCVDVKNKTIYYPIYYNSEKQWNGKSYVSQKVLYFLDIYNVRFTNSVTSSVSRAPGIIDCSDYINMWNYTELDEYTGGSSVPVLRKIAPSKLYPIDSNYSEFTIKNSINSVAYKGYIRDNTITSTLQGTTFDDTKLCTILNKIPVCVFNNNLPVINGTIMKTGWLPKFSSTFSTTQVSNSSYYCIPTTSLGSSEEQYKIPENLLKTGIDINGNAYYVPVVIFRDTLTLMPKGMLTGREDEPLEGYRDFLARNYLQAKGISASNITSSALHEVTLSEMIAYSGEGFNFNEWFNKYISPYINLFLQICHSATLENILGIQEINSNGLNPFENMRYENNGIKISNFSSNNPEINIISETNTNITISVPFNQYVLKTSPTVTIEKVKTEINRTYQKDVVHDYKQTQNIIINQVDLNGSDGNVTYNQTIPYKDGKISYNYCEDLLDYFKACRLRKIAVTDRNNNYTSLESCTVNYLVTQLTNTGISTIDHYIDNCIYDGITPENNTQNSYISRTLLSEELLIPQLSSYKTIYTSIKNNISENSENNLVILSSAGNDQYTTRIHVEDPVTPNCSRMYYRTNYIPTITVGETKIQASQLTEYPAKETDNISMIQDKILYDNIVVIDGTPNEVNGQVVSYTVQKIGWRNVLINDYEIPYQYQGSRWSPYNNDSDNYYPLTLVDVIAVSNRYNNGQFPGVNGLCYSIKRTINWTYEIYYVMTGTYKDSQNYLLGKGFDDNTYYQGIQFHYMFEKDVTDKDLPICKVGLCAFRKIEDYCIEDSQSASGDRTSEKIKHRKESIIRFDKLYGDNYRTLDDQIESISVPEIYSVPEESTSILYVGNHHYYNLLKFTRNHLEITMKVSPSTPYNECEYRNDYNATDGFEFSIILNSNIIRKLTSEIMIDGLYTELKSNVPIGTNEGTATKYLDLSNCSEIVQIDFKAVSVGSNRYLTCNVHDFSVEKLPALTFTDVTRDNDGNIISQEVEYTGIQQIDERLKKLENQLIWETSTLNPKTFVKNKFNYNSLNTNSSVRHTIVELFQSSDETIQSYNTKSLPPSYDNEDFEFSITILPSLYNSKNHYIHFNLLPNVTDIDTKITIKSDSNLSVVNYNYTYTKNGQDITLTNVPTIDIRQLGVLDSDQTIILNCKYVKGISPLTNYILLTVQNNIISKTPDNLTEKFTLEITKFNNGVWDWIQDRITNGNFSGINTGDYIPIVIGDQTYNMTIMGINTYKNSSSNHIDFISEILYSSHVINPDEVNNAFSPIEVITGDGSTTSFVLTNKFIDVTSVNPSIEYTYDNSTSTISFKNAPENGQTISCSSMGCQALNDSESLLSPWLCSDLYLYLNSMKGQVVSGPNVTDTIKRVNYEQSGVYDKLDESIKSVISNKYMYFEDKPSSTNWITSSTSCRYHDMGKLWVPTETEVFGQTINDDVKYTKIGSIQYELFKDVINRVKCPYGSATSQTWWLSNPFDGTIDKWCYVGKTGYAVDGISMTNYANYVPICFRVSSKTE